MYGGQCVEQGSVDDIFFTGHRCPARGDCSRRCREWIGPARPDSLPIPGSPPSLINIPKGCVFNPKMQIQDRVPNNLCAAERPDLIGDPTGHFVRCHIPEAQRRTIFANEIRPLL